MCNVHYDDDDGMEKIQSSAKSRDQVIINVLGFSEQGIDPKGQPEHNLEQVYK